MPSPARAIRKPNGPPPWRKPCASPPARNRETSRTRSEEAAPPFGLVAGGRHPLGLRLSQRPLRPWMEVSQHVESRREPAPPPSPFVRQPAFPLAVPVPVTIAHVRRDPLNHWGFEGQTSWHVHC